METFMYLTIAIFFIALTLTTVASFAFGYTTMQSWLEPKPVEKHPRHIDTYTSEELMRLWIDSLDKDYLKYESVDNIEDFMKPYITLSKESDNYLPF